MRLEDWFAGPAPAARRYVDPVSGEQHPLDAPRWRSDAGRPMLVSPGPGLAPADLAQAELAADRAGGERGLWRYRAALPFDIAAPISLGEGATPLVRLGAGDPADPAAPGARYKLEWFSPTGSFKDRGAAVMLSALRQQGVSAVIEDSSGNGGAAVAAYAAAGGLRATVFAPADASPAKLVQARAHGARIEAVPGERAAAQRAAIAEAERSGGCYASHNWQALFIEGTKTLAYELWEDLGFRAPDAVVVPVGAGSLLLGLALGFGELLRAGQVRRLPRLFAAQPLNCSPVDAAFRGEGERAVLPTVAEGTAIARPLRLPEMLAALRASGGGTVVAGEREILDARSRLAAAGLFVEPTSAVAAAGHERLLREGRVDPRETTVVVLTGSGLKSPDPTDPADPAPASAA